jgi:hypothetical protein
MIERIAGDTNAEDAAIGAMKAWYERAERRALEQNDPELYYPALNRIAAALLVDAGAHTPDGFDTNALATVRAALEKKTRDDPDFWSVNGQTELLLYEAIAKTELASRVAEIESRYQDLWARVTALGDWDTVNTQLRFVLPRYRDRTSGAERDAADGLLAYVRRLTARAKREAGRAT